MNSPNQENKLWFIKINNVINIKKLSDQIILDSRNIDLDLMFALLTDWFENEVGQGKKLEHRENIRFQLNSNA